MVRAAKESTPSVLSTLRRPGLSTPPSVSDREVTWYKSGSSSGGGSTMACSPALLVSVSVPLPGLRVFVEAGVVDSVVSVVSEVVVAVVDERMGGN